MHPEVGKIRCPKCEQLVDIVDDEYALHYVLMNIICTMSKREIDQERSISIFDPETEDKSNGKNGKG
jgi:hypothetical protein